MKTWIRAYVRWVVSIVLAWGMLAGSAPALSAREIESGGPSRQDELISAAQRAVVGTRVRPAQDTRAGAVMASSAPGVREAGDRAELDLSITDLGARSDDLSAQVLCAAPVAVDLEGPTTAIVDEFATFTATVIVVKATTPITYHWQFPGGLERTEALDTWTSSMTPRLSVTGTHMVTATVSNACGEIVSARRVQIVEPAQPDLVVTDFWSEGDEVWVQVTNVGQATAPGGHIVEVLAGDLVVGSQRVYDDLAPGRRWVGVMNGLWSCSGDQDTMQATADTSDVVDEKDERNNGRRETWRCDTQPPVITKGPAVSAITSDSARVSWLTDEPADSAVQYGTTLGGYQFTEHDTHLTDNHQVTLTGLRPSTAYQARVSSTDANGYRTVSRPFTFETAAAAGSLPVDPPTFSVVEDPRFDTYRLQVSYKDLNGVNALAPGVENIERVEFYVGAKHVGTDYEPEDGQYQVDYSPHLQGLKSAEFFGLRHMVTAKAWSWAGVGQVNPYIFEPQRDSIPVDVAITFPPDGHTIYIQGDQAPADTAVTIMVEAAQYDWRCTWNGGSMPLAGVAPDCGDVAEAVAQVQFIVDNQVKHTSYPSNDNDLNHGWTYEMGGFSPLPRTVRVRAIATDGVHHTVETTINIVQLPPAEPILNVHRQVTRHGNRFEVELVVENEAGASDYALIDRIEDNLTSFQAIHKNALSYQVRSEYDWHWSTMFTTKKDQVDIDVFTSANDSTIRLDPGESLTVKYDVVPVLYEDQPTFGIGDQNVKVTYFGSDGESNLKGFARPMEFFQSEAWASVHASRYLIVTHPVNLIKRFNMDSINELLSSMAHLARVTGGVLGYLESDNPRDVFDALIEPGGGWAVDMHANFEVSGLGNVLIVGETEIVPSWQVPWGDGVIRDSDQFYAAVGDGPPTLNLGRIIGNHPDNMRAVIENTIAVYEGRGGHEFDRSDALLLSGVGNMWDLMFNEVNYVHDVLEAQGTDAVKMHWRDYSALTAYLREFDKYDDLAAGDVVAGDGVDEIVVALDASNVIEVRDPAGNVLSSFSRSWEDGDAMAVGDVNNDGWDDIVVGDASADYIVILTETGGVTNLFPHNFDWHDGLAVGDVISGGGEEIVVADRDDHLYVYDYLGNLLHTFDWPYAADDRIAAGDVGSTSAEEIVILQETARSGDQITGTVTSLTISGGTLQTVDAFDIAKYEPGDSLAVGDTTGGGAAEIILGGRNGYISLVNAGGDWVRLAIPCTMDPYDGLAVGQFAAGSDAVIVAADMDDYVYTTDYYHIDREHWGYRSAVPNKDVLFFLGHGNPNSWAPALTTGDLPWYLGSGPHFPLSLGSTHPVVVGTTCLSGYYEDGDDYGAAEGFLDSGAAVYIGATQNSMAGPTEEALRWFFDNWDETEAAGKVWSDMERAKWADQDFRYTALEYNIYGDPTFGVVSGVTAAGAQVAGAGVPPSTITIQIPEYQVVTSTTGVDRVTLPGGELTTAPGKVQVPYWVHTVEISPGYQIQDVTLASRGGLTITTGLSLPIASGDIWGEPAMGRMPSQSVEEESDPEESWAPSLDQEFTWWVQDAPDGTSTLYLKVYPFYYNEQSTSIRFYNSYTFTVDSTASDVTLVTLDTGQPAYSQGDLVTIDLSVHNAGTVQDVTVEAAIKNAASGDVIDGLPLRALHEVTGTVDLAFAWDSSTQSAGIYGVEVTLRDGEGHVLDRGSEMFVLGIESGEVTALEVTPTLFQAGDSVDVSLTFSNTGSLALDGVTVIEIQTGDGVTTTATYTQSFEALLPGKDMTFATEWDTTGAAEQDYRVVGYVRYGSAATTPVVVPLSTRMQICLPVVLREAQ